MEVHLSAKRRWAVSATPRPLYPRKRPDTLCIRGWVGPRARLEGCGKSSAPPGFDPGTVQTAVSRYTDLSYAGATSYAYFLSPSFTNAGSIPLGQILGRHTSSSNYNTPREVRVIPTRAERMWKNGWKWLKKQQKRGWDERNAMSKTMELGGKKDHVTKKIRLRSISKR